MENINEPTETEKREMFADVLQRIYAIDFPKKDDISQKIHLLFHDEEDVKVAVYFLQDYKGTGFSLIIEEIDSDNITLKIYEPDTDDFYVCKQVPVRKNIFDIYKNTYKKDTLLSVGQLEIIDFVPKISPVSFLEIPIKSISFREKDEQI